MKRRGGSLDEESPLFRMPPDAELELIPEHGIRVLDNAPPFSARSPAP